MLVLRTETMWEGPLEEQQDLDKQEGRKNLFPERDGLGREAGERSQ
jgi:hypothetical protein